MGTLSELYLYKHTWENSKSSPCILFEVYCGQLFELLLNILEIYVAGSKIFRPDIQKPRQMENALRDI